MAIPHMTLWVRWTKKWCSRYNINKRSNTKTKWKNKSLSNTPVIWELEWMEDYNYRTGWNWEMFSKYEYIQWPDALCTSNCHAEIPIVSFDKYDQKSAIHK